jgi:hemolysin III
MEQDRDPDHYPAYGRAERIADGVMHALGVTFALIGAVLLITYAALSASGGEIAAVTVYAGALMATFLASACYHLTPWEHVRPTLRRVDHAAIFLKIAGTYTPFVVLIHSAFAYAILAVVWSLALSGALLRLLKRGKLGRIETWTYLLLGWLSLLLVWPMVQTLPAPATALVLAGGLLYTLGVVFFRWESLRFSNAIWHAFVLAASACFFAAITLGIISGA